MGRRRPAHCDHRLGPDTPPATTRFAYDGAERVPGEVVDPEGGLTRLVVADGLVREVVDPDGVRVRFAHDTDGNVVEAVDALGGTTRVERAPDTGPMHVLPISAEASKAVIDRWDGGPPR